MYSGNLQYVCPSFTIRQLLLLKIYYTLSYLNLQQTILLFRSNNFSKLRFKTTLFE